MSDDAAITLRSVLNVLHGGGAGYNWGERVDAFTDPAWFLLITLGGTTGINVFWVTLSISLALSIATLLIVWRYCATSVVNACIALGALLLSKSFIDFSSSGLENPLGAFLVAAGFATALRLLRDRGPSGMEYVLALCIGTLYLTRVDLTLVLLPIVATVAIRRRPGFRRLLRLVLVAVALPFAWTLFSLLYFGYPVPNTAYAKLGGGVGKGALVLQGIKYLMDSISRDPITLALILIAVILAAMAGGAAHRAAAMGLVLYLGYTVWIGGDFMTGRFFMVPAVLAAAVVAATPLSTQHKIVLAGLLGLLGALGLPGTLLSGSGYSNQAISTTGIADERGFWFQKYGMVADGALGYEYPSWTPSAAPKLQVACGGIGQAGIQGGPSLHIIDTCGLADPVLSHVPAIVLPDWRIGHFVRALPDNYRESVELDRNLLENPSLRRYYRAVRLITRSPDLLAPDRLQAIWSVNSGAVQPGTTYTRDTHYYG